MIPGGGYVWVLWHSFVEVAPQHLALEDHQLMATTSVFGFEQLTSLE